MKKEAKLSLARHPKFGNFLLDRLGMTRGCRGRPRTTVACRPLPSPLVTCGCLTLLSIMRECPANIAGIGDGGGGGTALSP